MANGNLQSVVDHSLVKLGTPVFVFAMMGLIGWLFSTVLELEETVSKNVIHLEHLHMAEESFGKKMESVESTLTDLRINVGRLSH